MDKNFIIADNQAITKAGLYRYITTLSADFCIEEAINKKELVSKLMECDQRVVVIDYTLFDLEDVEELVIISNRFPKVNWLLFSSELSENIIRRLSVCSTISMVLKENSGEEILSALRYAWHGERFLCHEIVNLLFICSDRQKTETVLTPVETDILKLIAHGKSTKEIATQRVVSIHTIVTHKKNIFRKLEINNVYEATRYALRAGLIEMAEYYI